MTSVFTFRSALAALCLMLLAAVPAEAALKIDITQGNVEPLPIAVLDFDSDQPAYFRVEDQAFLERLMHQVFAA